MIGHYKNGKSFFMYEYHNEKPARKPDKSKLKTMP